MDKMLEAETKTDALKKEKLDYKAEIAETFAQIHRLAEETNQSQAETAQLRVETREILDRLKAIYNVA